MNKIMILFFVAFFISIAVILDAQVETELYVVEKPDGSVSIINYILGSGDSLEGIVNDLGFSGLPIKKITKNDLPNDRSDRKYWKLNQIPIGKKIEIDTVKKQADETAKTIKEARKQALLKMTPAEFQEAKDLGLVR